MNFIIVTNKRTRRLTAPEIRVEVNQTRVKPLSLTTVKRRLRGAKLYGHVAVRKSAKTTKQEKTDAVGSCPSRLDCRRFKKSSLVQWIQVWTIRLKRRIYFRRSAQEKMMRDRVVLTIKHGAGSVMVWGCFPSQVTGDLIIIEGILKKEQYNKN